MSIWRSIQFVSFRFVLFRFVSICFVSFRSVSFRFDLFRFVSICFVSFRFVSVSFRTLQGPSILWANDCSKIHERSNHYGYPDLPLTMRLRNIQMLWWLICAISLFVAETKGQKNGRYRQFVHSPSPQKGKRYDYFVAKVKGRNNDYLRISFSSK